MSSYNYNVQISLAGSHAISQEQEKAKNAEKKHQEHAGAVMQRNAEAHNKVSAVPNDEVTYQVHNEKEHSEAEFSASRNTQRGKREGTTDVLVDDKKGTKVNIVC